MFYNLPVKKKQVLAGVNTFIYQLTIVKDEVPVLQVLGSVITFIHPAMKNILLLLVALLLLTASGSYAQQLDYSQRSWLKDNAYTIHPDETFSKASWEYIFPHINDKRIILVGEFTHGAKEIFLLRNELIRFLHEQLGFNTILFESGIGELAAADINRRQLNTVQMTAGFSDAWHSKENRDLVEYVKKNNISVAGFDAERTGNAFRKLFSTVAHTYDLDTAFCGTLEDRFSVIQRELADKKTVYDAVSPKTTTLITDYQKIYTQLSGNRSGNFSRELLLTRRTLINRIRYLEYMLRFVQNEDGNRRLAARDSVMAENTRWLADSIYKNEKLVVISHNFHIAKHNDPSAVMGELLCHYYPGNTYSIGIFAGTGSYADNKGKEIKLLPPDTTSTDLKHIIALLPGFTSYLHIPENKVSGTDWLYKDVVVNDTFIDLNSANKMILARQFDGVLLLKKVSPPGP